ncbi:hypothetical protein JMA_28640 [Jeotgalibacillus malaysiensis]|uniref:NERD domain-containing protein n=1 Tax=Jeotgalibacillus malaysiensis TaxID=1508404 RepID=A0A0B5AQ02_9BACL|nr:nuclease-related domain-containing protein [Jeotgalibacillus malaysiensis]AJD92181.1 hypothetical protein JMA_28640 [Jeotgalibacillus malaysiensis]
MVQLNEDFRELELKIENKVLSDLSIHNESFQEPLNIDRIVFTSGGIFVIQYCEARGFIDGHPDRQVWLSDGDVRIKNPLMENQLVIDSLKMVIPPYFHDFFYSVVGFKRRVKLNVQGNHRDIEGKEFMLGENEISEYIERIIYKKIVQQNKPIKPHHLNILERGLRWMNH